MSDQAEITIEAATGTFAARLLVPGPLVAGSPLTVLPGRWFSARLGQDVVYDLRTQVFSHVQRQPIASFTRAQTGALVPRLNTDVIGTQQAITVTLSSVVGNIISLAVILATMFYLPDQILVMDGARTALGAALAQRRS